MSVRPPPPPRTKSGEHPAVTGYRKKLDSIADGAADLELLNQQLADYLASSKPPPPLSEDAGEDPADEGKT